MCGLAGFLAFETSLKRSNMHQIAKSMTDAIVHRGPDSHDIWQDADVALALGHRRLAILDLSPEGHQPMASETGRYMIVYNGEVYNHLELRAELEGAGIRFRGRSDTETILAACEHWGINRSLQKLNGMFAIALWDKKDRALHLIRDRLGKKPLYLGWSGKSFVFASELKSFHAHPDFQPEIDKQAFGIYMRCGYVTAPHCIYKNVWILPAGHRLTIDLAVNSQKIAPGDDLSENMESYWHHGQVLQAAQGNPYEGSESQAVEEFEKLLSTCTRQRMISDVPLGAFLSGGIDSSAIAAIMQLHSPNPIKTYTIGFHEAGFNEAEYAKKVAAHLGTDHHELYLKPGQALDIIPTMPDIYDEPFADFSSIPTFLVSKFARQDVTVALSGDGGDEMLGGYNRHFMGPKIWNKIKYLPRSARRALAASIHAVSQERWDKTLPGRPQFGRAMHKLADLLPMRGPHEIYESLINHWDHPPFSFDTKPLPLLHEDHGAVAGLNFGEQMMLWDTLSYLPNDILTKVDRASMAVSLETRAPLLDYRIFEFAWRLPESYKLRNGKGKWLLRQVLGRHVPRELFERPKQGFTVPIGAWLRGPLQDWAEDLLGEDSLKAHGLLNTHMVRSLWAAHKQGSADHTMKLWTALMFQAWHRRWM